MAASSSSVPAAVSEKEQVQLASPAKSDVPDRYATFQEAKSVGSLDIVSSRTEQGLPLIQQAAGTQLLPSVGGITASPSKSGLLYSGTGSQLPFAHFAEMTKPPASSSSDISLAKGNQVAFLPPPQDDDFFTEFADFKSASISLTGTSVCLQSGPSLAAPLLQSGPSLAAPLLQPGPPLAAPLLQSGPSLAAPLLQSGPSLAAPLLQSGPSFAAPLLQPGPSLTAPLLQSGPPLAAPLLQSGPSLAAPLLHPADVNMSKPPAVPASVSPAVSQSWEDDFDDFKSAPASSIGSGPIQNPPTLLESAIATSIPSKSAPKAYDLLDFMADFAVPPPQSSGELPQPHTINEDRKPSLPLPNQTAHMGATLADVPIIQESTFAEFADFKATSVPPVMATAISSVSPVMATAVPKATGTGFSSVVDVSSHQLMASVAPSFPEGDLSTEFSEFADFSSSFPASTSIQAGAPVVLFTGTSNQFSAPLTSTTGQTSASGAPLISTILPFPSDGVTINIQPVTAASKYVNDLPEDDFDDFKSAAPLSSGETGHSGVQKPSSSSLGQGDMRVDASPINDISKSGLSLGSFGDLGTLALWEQPLKTSDATTNLPRTSSTKGFFLADFDDLATITSSSSPSLAVNQGKPPTIPAPPQSSVPQLDAFLNTSFDASFDEFDEFKSSCSNAPARSPSRHSGESLFFEGADTTAPTASNPVGRVRAVSLALDDDVGMLSSGWGGITGMSFKTLFLFFFCVCVWQFTICMSLPSVASLPLPVD